LVACAGSLFEQRRIGGRVSEVVLKRLGREVAFAHVRFTDPVNLRSKRSRRKRVS
jgi:hypothetical protein